MAPKATGKKALPKAPLGAKKALAKKEKKSEHEHLFERRPRKFGIGQDVQPKRDLGRYVRWPKFVQLQRQKKILLTRLKVPPAIAQFQAGMDKNHAATLIRLASKYKPETRHQKKERLMSMAKAKAAGEEVAQKKPHFLKHGVNHVTTLIEEKRAKLVVIAHDVDPIELVCWLPALCRKKDVPYCIIKGKHRLGKLVGMKKTSCIALTSVRKEDTNDLEAFVKNARTEYNDNVEHRRRWGGGIMGKKSQDITRARERVLAAEQAKKIGLRL